MKKGIIMTTEQKMTKGAAAKIKELSEKILVLEARDKSDAPMMRVSDHEYEMRLKEERIEKQKMIIETIQGNDESGVSVIKARILEWVEAMNPKEIIEAAKVWPTL